MSGRETAGGPTTSRRGLMRVAAGATAAATLGAGATGTVTAQDGGDFDGWLSDVGNYDGTVADRTGQDSVTITVGAQGNGGGFAYGPPAVRVDPGTTVVWEWNGEGGAHNVVGENRDFSSGDPVAEAGTTYEQTFEEEGVVKYFCTPHKTLGMKGVVVVGGSGGSGGGGNGGGQQATPVPAEYGDWMNDVGNFDGETVDRRGEDSVTITVGAEGNGGGFAFAPPAVRISPGTTVVWEWNGEGGAHNVVGENRDFSSGDPVAEAGTTYERTFEEPGIVKYLCDPHLSLGMKGALVVDPSSPGGGGGDGSGQGGGGEGTATPGGFLIGIVLGVFSPIVFTALWLLRGKKIGRAPQPAGAGAGGEQLGRAEDVDGQYATTEAPVEEPDTEIGHDEFDPTGTAGLIIIYFVILAVLWVFMYFVEFLGNGPTIIG